MSVPAFGSPPLSGAYGRFLTWVMLPLCSWFSCAAAVAGATASTASVRKAANRRIRAQTQPSPETGGADEGRPPPGGRPSALPSSDPRRDPVVLRRHAGAVAARAADLAPVGQRQRDPDR